MNLLTNTTYFVYNTSFDAGHEETLVLQHYPRLSHHRSKDVFCCDNLLITISMLDNLTVLQESEWNTFIELYKYIFTQLPESYIFLRSIMRLTNCCPTYMLSVTALTIGRDVLFWPSQIHLPKCKVVEWGGQNMTLNFFGQNYILFLFLARLVSCELP